jgi:hypothetical protein
VTTITVNFKLQMQLALFRHGFRSLAQIHQRLNWIIYRSSLTTYSDSMTCIVRCSYNPQGTPSVQ